MATIAPTVTTIGIGDGATRKAVWATVTSADTVTAIAFPEWTDRSVQTVGTYDSATVAVHGSNDGTNFAALHDPGGTAIGLTADGIKQILENTALVKPSISGGGGGYSITVTMIIRLHNPLRQ